MTNNPPSTNATSGISPKASESPRQAYIRLLRERISFPDTLHTDQRDMVLKAELIEGGYLDGVVNPNSSGMFPSSVIVGLPKAKGRLFLQQLERDEFDLTWRGRIKKREDIFVGFLLGIIASVVLEILKYGLGTK